MFVINILDDMC